MTMGELPFKEVTNSISTKNIVILAVIVHLVLVMSVFDIYFVSPITHGMTTHRGSKNPPAKRLVLIIVDGLRSQALFNSEMAVNAPFLNNIKNNHGSWGISHTRVPTESRPGHVAILAGIYEDPSAVFKRWKANPVHFDSIVNESRNVWYWGCPDIIDLFNRDNLRHIHQHTYNPNMVDFSGKESHILMDKWVFHAVDKFFLNLVNASCTDFCSDQNLIFLHLLGVDTAGHTFKPHSTEYIHNIKLVDEGAKLVDRLFEDYFKDDLTAYVLTADHGMTDWGAHGDGSDVETYTPLIAWGAGIIRNKERHDVKQTDIAPLVASLIGINIPINSIGVVPFSYLNVTTKEKAQIMYSNVLQLIEQYNAKKSKVEESTIKLLYKPFNNLADEQLKGWLEAFNSKLLGDKDEELLNYSLKFIELIHKGLEYYYNYYQYPLLFSMTVGFLGWMAFLCLTICLDDRTILDMTKNQFVSLHRAKMIRNLFYVGFVVVCGLVHVQSLPRLYYIYFTFPLLTWYLVIKQANAIVAAFIVLSRFGIQDLMFTAVMYIGLIELLLFTFLQRATLTVSMLLLAGWIVIQTHKLEMNLKVTWICCCAVLSVFPLLPVMKTNFSYTFFNITALSWALLILWIMTRKNVLNVEMENFGARLPRLIILLQCIVLLLSFVNVFFVTESINNKKGLPLLNQCFSWFTLVFSFVSPTLVYRNVVLRLSSIMISLMSTYILTATSYEGMFMCLFLITLYNWLLVESGLITNHPITNVCFGLYENHLWRVSKKDFRRAYFFMVFLLLAFFGTGNIAKVNSFDPMWVKCYLTVFSFYTMMAVILIKFMIPFLFVSCVYRAINYIAGGKIKTIFIIVLLFSDVMVLSLLYLVRNEGSWLDIGTSVSNFLIMEAITVCLLVLYGIAHVLTQPYDFICWKHT